MLTIPMNALRTRRAEFLGEMDRLLPWPAWERLIAPHVPKHGKGRPPYPLAQLLRYYLLRQWFQLSDQAARDLVADSMAVREFMGLGLTWEKGAPDEATYLKFRRLIERHALAERIAANIADCLNRQGWKIRPGEIAEAGIVARREVGTQSRRFAPPAGSLHVAT